MPIPGTTTVGGPVAPSSELDTYAAHSEQWGRGGYRTVADYTERDAITAERRKEGQLVHVLSDDSWWELDAGLTNGNWIIPSFAIAANGAVSLERNGYPTRWFRPSANTNAARFAALQDAMSVADDNLSVTAIVTLMFGQFGIPSGTSITDFAPVNAIIVFGPESSVLYADENDAGDDARLYPGNERYAKNFGAVPDMVTDCIKPIQAAFFSLPTVGNTVESIAKYPNLRTRNGTVYLEGTGFLISDTIYMTGFQKLVGLCGRMTQIYAADGFAPDAGPEKFMVYTAAATLPDPPNPPIIAPNFSFDIQIINIQFATNFQSNSKLSALYYGCGQGGRLNCSWANMGQKGLWIRDGSMYFVVENVLGVGRYPDSSWLQKGPHIYGRSLLGIKFSLLSTERINWDPSNRISFTAGAFSGADLAAIMISDSNSLEFENVNGEVNGSLMHLKNVNNTIIGCVNNLGAQPDPGLTMVTLENVVNCSFRSLAGANFAKLLEVTGFGAMTLTGGTAGPMVIHGQFVRTMTANPTTAQIPSNYGYFVKNTTSGEMRFWYNDGGTMKSIGPAVI